MNLVSSQTPDSVAKKQLASKQLRFKLATLIRTSETMLELAEANDWKKVEALESVRKQDLLELSGMSESDMITREIADAYTALLAINDKITRLVENEKNVVMQNFQSGKQTARAAQQYGNM